MGKNLESRDEDHRDKQRAFHFRHDVRHTFNVQTLSCSETRQIYDARIEWNLTKSDLKKPNQPVCSRNSKKKIVKQQNWLLFKGCAVVNEVTLIPDCLRNHVSGVNWLKRKCLHITNSKQYQTSNYQNWGSSFSQQRTIGTYGYLRIATRTNFTPSRVKRNATATITDDKRGEKFSAQKSIGPTWFWKYPPNLQYW